LCKNGIEDNSLLTIYAVNCDALVWNGGGAYGGRRPSPPLFPGQLSSKRL